MKKIILFVFIALLAGHSLAQNTDKLTRILFVFDASNSMNKKWGKDTRMVTAKGILSDAVDSLRGIPHLQMALRVYGDQYPVTPTYKNCHDTRLAVPFAKNNGQAILDQLKTIQAKGTTPIALSLKASASDFPDTNSRNIIVLITDGKEECGGDPCTIAKLLHEKGISVKPFVVGIGMDLSYLNYFKCIGKYMSAETPSSFRSVLKSIVDRAIGNTTAQINLNTVNGEPRETNVSMFLYKAGTHDLVYTFTHTMNRLNLPDTLILDPKIKYDLYVKTLPQQVKKNITLIPNTHNIISVDAPQGKLKIQFDRPTNYNYGKIRVMQEGKYKTLNVQEFNTSQKYIVGTYKLEILTLPRRYKTVKVQQSTTTMVTIEAPGLLNINGFKPTTGQIFEVKDDGTHEWVCDLDESKLSNQFVIQPGKYELVYRRKDYQSTTFTRKKIFYIYSNKKETINL